MDVLGISAGATGWSRNARTQERPLLVCFSHLRWNFVYQRPQHLMTRAAQDYEVVFFEEPLFEPAAVPRLDRRAVAEHLTTVVPIVPAGVSRHELVRIQRMLVERLLRSLAKRQRVLWYYTPMALEFTRHLASNVCVYDNMDELSGFKNPPVGLLELEKELFARCDLVFCGGQSLFEAKRGRHPSVHLFRSSIDRAHFARARKATVDPPDQAQLSHPRLGFFGVIDERMDLELLGRMVALRPQWQWIMLGPVAKIDPATLPQSENLHWLGQRSYDQLPAYLAYWDIGIMPFALNESTRFISPTKTPEFLASGVPVVSSPIRDVVRPYAEQGLVEIASSAEEWVEKAGQLLEEEHSAWLARVDRFLVSTSWSQTWQGMQALIRAQLEPKALAPTYELNAASRLLGRADMSTSAGSGAPVAADVVKGAGHL